ncbi:MAG: rod shape-determining protein MreC [Desulfamplus sp.]|nr:rod shape-determining protein MreC [Desulfamplus sp.]
MFSTKTVLLIGIVLFIATSFTVLTVSSRNALPDNGIENIAIALISPFQMAVSASFAWCSGIWRVYFATVSAGNENIELKKELALAMGAQNRCMELELENSRLRSFIDFNNASENVFIAAKVIGRDPSPWFQTLMINKGSGDGLIKGLPVLVSEGVVGRIETVSENFSRVLLITDRNSAVDALVQSSRARGIVQGNNTDQCLFKYALRKDEIVQGDIIVSSGLDQVFPKGLRIGKVLDIQKENSDLFQMIIIKTFVNFDKLEEVLVASVPDIPIKNSESEDNKIEDSKIDISEDDSENLSDKPGLSSQKQASSNSIKRSSQSQDSAINSDNVPAKKNDPARQNVPAKKNDPARQNVSAKKNDPARQNVSAKKNVPNRENDPAKEIKKSVKNSSSKPAKPSKKEEQ